MDPSYERSSWILPGYFSEPPRLKRSKKGFTHSCSQVFEEKKNHRHSARKFAHESSWPSPREAEYAISPCRAACDSGTSKNTLGTEVISHKKSLPLKEFRVTAAASSSKEEEKLLRKLTRDSACGQTSKPLERGARHSKTKRNTHT